MIPAAMLSTATLIALRFDASYYGIDSLNQYLEGFGETSRLAIMKQLRDRLGEGYNSFRSDLIKRAIFLSCQTLRPLIRPIRLFSTRHPLCACASGFVKPKIITDFTKEHRSLDDLEVDFVVSIPNLNTWWEFMIEDLFMAGYHVSISHHQHIKCTGNAPRLVCNFNDESCSAGPDGSPFILADFYDVSFSSLWQRA